MKPHMLLLNGKWVNCQCLSCLKSFLLSNLLMMVLCQFCGNKRCPHATDHRNACTRSNAPGQPGSAYE